MEVVLEKLIVILNEIFEEIYRSIGFEFVFFFIYYYLKCNGIICKKVINVFEFDCLINYEFYVFFVFSFFGLILFIKRFV